MPMFSDSIRGLAAALICAAIGVAALVLGRDVLMPFALATILAFILAPIVRKLNERRVPHGAAVGIVVLSMLAIVAAGMFLFSAQLLSLTASLAGYKDNLTQKVRTIAGTGSHDNVFRKAAASVDTLGRELKKETDGGSTPAPPSILVARESADGASTAFEQLKSALHPLATAGLTLLFAMFLLAQHHDIRDRVVRLAGIDNMTDTTSALSEAGTRLSRLFLRQAALNAGFGAVVGVALAVIGVPNAALWGIATFFLRFVPFIGSIIAAVPPILLAAAVDPGWGMVIATTALFLIGEPIVGHLIEPHVLGKGVGLSSFAMVAAASFWTLVWGPVGLILAAPLTMSVVVLGQYIPRLEFMSVLLGDTPALAPEQEFYHRLLSDDAAAAAEQFESAAHSTSVGAASDNIALAALRIAARDYRNDRLDGEQTNALKETMDAVVELVGDGIATLTATDAAADTQTEPRLRIMVVPARGPIDIVAAKFAAAMLAATTRHECIAIEHATGLMGLSAARSAAGDGNVDALILSTVGGIDHQHLKLLERRAVRDFPHTRLIVSDWASPTSSERKSAEADIATTASLVGSIALLAYARPTPVAAETPPGAAHSAPIANIA